MSGPFAVCEGGSRSANGGDVRRAPVLFGADVPASVLPYYRSKDVDSIVPPSASVFPTDKAARVFAGHPREAAFLADCHRRGLGDAGIKKAIASDAKDPKRRQAWDAFFRKAAFSVAKAVPGVPQISGTAANPAASVPKTPMAVPQQPATPMINKPITTGLRPSPKPTAPVIPRPDERGGQPPMRLDARDDRMVPVPPPQAVKPTAALRSRPVPPSPAGTAPAPPPPQAPPVPPRSMPSPSALDPVSRRAQLKQQFAQAQQKVDAETYANRSWGQSAGEGLADYGGRAIGGLYDNAVRRPGALIRGGLYAAGGTAGAAMGVAGQAVGKTVGLVNTQAGQTINEASKGFRDQMLGAAGAGAKDFGDSVFDLDGSPQHVTQYNRQTFDRMHEQAGGDSTLARVANAGDWAADAASKALPAAAVSAIPAVASRIGAAGQGAATAWNGLGTTSKVLTGVGGTGGTMVGYEVAGRPVHNAVNAVERSLIPGGVAEREYNATQTAARTPEQAWADESPAIKTDIDAVRTAGKSLGQVDSRQQAGYFPSSRYAKETDSARQAVGARLADQLAARGYKPDEVADILKDQGYPPPAVPSGSAPAPVKPPASPFFANTPATPTAATTQPAPTQQQPAPGQPAPGQPAPGQPAPGQPQPTNPEQSQASAQKAYQGLSSLRDRVANNQLTPGAAATEFQSHADEIIKAQAAQSGISPAILKNRAAKILDGGEVTPQELEEFSKNTPPGLMEHWDALPTTQKAMIAVGLPMAAIGLGSSLFGEGGMGSILMGLLGLGGAAAGMGAFGGEGPLSGAMGHVQTLLGMDGGQEGGSTPLPEDPEPAVAPPAQPEQPQANSPTGPPSVPQTPPAAPVPAPSPQPTQPPAPPVPAPAPQPTQPPAPPENMLPPNYTQRYGSQQAGPPRPQVNLSDRPTAGNFQQAGRGDFQRWMNPAGKQPEQMTTDDMKMQRDHLVHMARTLRPNQLSQVANRLTPAEAAKMVDQINKGRSSLANAWQGIPGAEADRLTQVLEQRARG